MNLSDYDFHLPKNLIATKPVNPRDMAKLLVYDRKTKTIIDDHFYNIDKHLVKNTTLAFNNSKVEQCRLIFGSKEIFVLESVNDNTVVALVRPGKQFKIGNIVELNEEITAEVLDINDEGHRTLRFNVNLDDDNLAQYQHIPLPPYIPQNDDLKEEYQTVYAKPLGSKAAPTAGLHFTDSLLKKLAEHHPTAYLTLHVGLGTFAPLTEDNIKSGKLHSEWCQISKVATSTLNNAKHITAVGTTTTRLLESAIINEDTKFKSGTFETDIFIQPGYKFKAVDSLITNFHLPKSSLLMLVSAFTSKEEVQKIYKHAVENSYRFYSFGDAMLII